MPVADIAGPGRQIPDGAPPQASLAAQFKNSSRKDRRNRKQGTSIGRPAFQG